MIQRLLEFMRIKNLTSSQLADAIGVQRSGISHFVSGRNKPSLEFILKILNHYPDVNPDWLLLGIEPVFRNGVIPNPVPEKNNSFSAVPVSLSASEQENVQPSFLDELFNDSPKSDEFRDEPVVKYERDARSQPESHPQSKKKKSEVDDDIKRESGQLPAEKSRKASAERIVIFYNDSKFREYFPDEQ